MKDQFDSLKTFNVAIVGGGPGCLAIMDMISKDRLREIRMHLVGIADTNPRSPAFERAQSMRIYTTTDYRDLFKIPGLDLIIELTGRPEVRDAILEEKPPQVQLMDHTVARLFWEIITLEDERLRTEKEAEKRIKNERDHTNRILNNLNDAVIVLGRDRVIESVNETFLCEFRLGREEVIGKPYDQVFLNRESRCADILCPLPYLDSNGLKTRRREYMVERDGEEVYYEADYSLLADEEGDRNRLLVTMRNISHRKRLELKLEKSEKKYKDLFQHAREGLALFDENGKILETNFTLAHMLGYSKEELEQAGISDLTETYSKMVLRDHLEGLKVLGFTAVEMNFVTKGGHAVPVEANITWLPYENLFRIMLRDITLKKKLEQSRKMYSERLEREVEERTRELKASEQETKNEKRTAEGIIYGSPIPMFVLDRHHTVIYWNKACERLTGCRSEEMIGTARHWEPFYSHKRPLLADLIIEGDLETMKELYRDMNLRRSAMVEGAYEAEHFFPQLGDGGTHLYFNAAPITDDAGKIQGAITTYQDLTERVKMTQKIKRREAFVQNLIRNSIDAVIATDSEDRIIVFNPGAVQIFGYAPQETIGKLRFQDILPEQTALTVREAIASDKEGPPGKIINMEVAVRNRANEILPVRLSGTLLYQNEKELGSVFFVQDLREIHRLQKEKEQAQRMAAIGSTVAGLAHYIKNVLNGLKGGAYVINSGTGKQDLELVKKGWGMVERNIEQISTIVTDMLIYSREREPKYEILDPNEVVGEVLDLMEERAKLSDVTIVRQQDPRIEKVPMDKTAIFRCLLNLVSNAVDACTLEGITDGRGMVIVKTDRPPGCAVRFQVSDNGTGMDEETQKKLFTYFFTTKGYKGTGLGLPVTQKIVEEHGGNLTFETEPGKGTTFTLTLPVRIFDSRSPVDEQAPR